ncbi:MAG TPA: SH3 domain-containing protein [Chthoniobacterales bacterium]|nr:SH3 domain-containing protein [Chthoniobacterales bacterium]
MRSTGFIAYTSFAALLVFGLRAHGQDAGATSEPDIGLRAEQNTNAPVVATVKRDEPFTYECEPKAEWCKVTLRSGETGWLECAAIRDHYTEKDLPEKDDPKNPSEINTLARSRGFNYDTTVRAAARGDAKALKQFFAMAEDVDGAAAESYAGTPTTVFHLVGDAKFAAFLKAQPVKFRLVVRNSIAGDSATAYLRRHFPETVAILFYREMTDWPSPNGRYAIRKVFSDEFALSDSKVTRAELIEKENGKVLCDMTADDIGWGRDREGIVLWSPDSKRFAYMSAWMKQSPGKFSDVPPPAPKKKQTVVYQLSGESFAKVDLPLGKAPGREKDEELTGAVLGHQYTEPIRWAKPNVLILQRHEYYQKFKPITSGGVKFESIIDLGRLYQVTTTIKPDGKATVVWKLRKDR